MATFKELHTKWKTAKGNLKRTWDTLGGLTMTVGVADVKHATIGFPKFDKKLGPSLDNLQANKDVKKSKETADKAVTQYEKDLKALKESHIW